MLIKTQSIYKISLALLLLAPLIILSIEINILMILFFTLFILVDGNKKYSKELPNIIFPLLAILLISIFSSFYYSSKTFDVIKDFFFLLKPILHILLGYYFVSKLENKSFVFLLIIYSATFFALLHLFKTGAFLSREGFDINLLRNFAGRGNAIEIFATVLLFSKKGNELFSIKSRHKRLIKLIILVSFIFYFSRTTTVSVIILFLAINGYLTITRKGLTYMAWFLVFVSLFYAYLFSITIERDDNKISGFFYKLKIAPSEIFTSAKIDVNDHVDLWDHWRAYEAQKAIEQLGDTAFSVGLITGKGVGSLVDLGFVAPLNEEGMQYITTLHNGYTFIMYKSGILGLIFYLLFLLVIYLQVYKSNDNFKAIIINNLLSGIAVYYVFTTLIVTGIYNPRDFGGIFLGAFLYLSHYYTKAQLNREIERLNN